MNEADRNVYVHIVGLNVVDVESECETDSDLVG